MRAEAPAYSRRIVRSTLIGEDVEKIEAAALLTSELVTAAMTDGCCEPHLFVDVRRGHLHVEVYDAHRVSSPGRADVRANLLALESAATRESWLRIVDELSSSWGHGMGTDSGALWFDLDL
jgi:hypothetical protein